MHIGLLIYGSIDTVSGGYLYDRQLALFLQSAGHTVEIISLPWHNYPRHLLQNLDARFLRRLAQGCYDILLQDELNHPSLCWLNRHLRKQVKYPLVSIVHHLRSSEEHPLWVLPFYRSIEGAYLNQIDGCIYNSQTTQQAVQQFLQQKIPSIIAYPAADHRLPPPAAEVNKLIGVRSHTHGPLRILFVGTVIPRKGLHVLIDAVAQLTRGRYQVHVLGSLTVDSAYCQQIRAQIHAHELDDVITLHGTQEDNAIRGWLSQSQLFVAPGYEGFGIAYLEAMSFGLPVIAATTGAAHELVTNSVNGFLVEPTDVTRLAEKIDWLAQNRTQLAIMGLAARARYDQHPTWQESFAPVERWLEEIVR